MFRLSMRSVTKSFLRLLGDPLTIVRVNPFEDQRCVERVLLWRYCVNAAKFIGIRDEIFDEVPRVVPNVSYPLSFLKPRIALLQGARQRLAFFFCTFPVSNVA